MRENNKFNELTLEELYTKKQKLQGAVIGLGIVMIITCVVLIYLAIKSQNIALIVVALGGGISLLPSVVSLNQINTEIKSRTSK